ncbi:MAG: recombinase family protein [Planctomycetes bacterium]|nr:recombinase family protein [Planctomycetota bacterium]
MVEAVTYLRVSGKGQIRGDGFPRQRTVVQRHAKSRRMQIVKEFRDEGASGTNDLEHREGLASLLDFIESREIKVVLVERVDRFARDLMVGEIILGQFRDLGVRVITSDSGIDLTTSDDDPTRTLIRQVLGAISQFEKTVIVLKLRVARERIRKSKGRCEGRKPFGTKLGESTTLKRMKQLRRKSSSGSPMSFARIAEVLNFEEYCTRQGKPWRASSVRKILSR